jgi:hypothetical protein
VFLINGGAVSWSTHKQSTIAFSSLETEYMSLSDAAREARHLFEELQILFASMPVTILTDSQAALDISENPANYRQAQQIDTRYHAVKHCIRDNRIEIDYIPPNYQPADIFTKAFGHTKHHRFCQMVGLRNSFEAFEDFKLIRNLEEEDYHNDE